MKFNLTILAFLFLGITAMAQEKRVPLGSNVFLKQNEETNIISKNLTTTKLGKADALTIPFIDFFNNKFSAKPNKTNWFDSTVTIDNLNAIFDTKNTVGAVYNTGFGMADVLTSQLLNTSAIGNNVFVSINFSTGADWQLNDSLVFQVKGNSGVWNTLWVSNNEVVLNKDVIFNLPFTADLRTNLFQFRFVSYCNTDTDKQEVFKLHQLAISYKNNLPFYESFRQFNTKTFTPINTRWYNFNNNITPNDSDIMLWGNSVIFNSITQIADSSYFTNNGAYGNADTLIANPIDLSKTTASDQLVMSFWFRSFNQTRVNDSIYLEALDNLGRWQRIWASGKVGTSYQNVNISVGSGRLRHQFFTFRFINKGTYLNTETASFALAALKITAKRNLPLFDDFSSTVGYYPNTDLWIDNKVFINNNFPRNQPSINVATFDGLDEFGNAYSKLPIKGVSDILTSKGFDLSSYTLKDSIYLSFYYQYHLQGTTGQIQPTDSLILEFRFTPNDADSFETVWKKSALDTLGYDTFNRILIALPAKYLHTDFQFRFKNIGSLTGNVSQWHIDYIKLDAGRSLKDTFNDDLAISSTPTSLLKKYRSMPWKHFILNKPAYTNDSIYFSIFNNGNRNYSVNFRRTLIDNEKSIVFIDSTIISDDPNLISGSVPFSRATTWINKRQTNLISPSPELVKKFDTKVNISNNGFAGNDNAPSNDSITTTTTFSNYFAYDDGSAEAGYGIYLKNTGSVALAYDIEKIDTIYGVQIFFNQSELNVSTRKFDLVLWDNITPVNQTATNDRVIYRKTGLSPIYTNTINGFATILFDSAIVVPKRFYVGWEQVGQFVLNVGLDENYYVGNKMVTNPNMFYKTDGFWLPTEIPGALMIRPMLGQIVDVPTNIVEPKRVNTFEFNLYPNPTTQNFTIELSKAQNCQAFIFDLTGKQLASYNLNSNVNNIDASGLQSGIYIVQVVNELTGAKYSKKLIIN